jgi:hypothetical protein
MIPERGERMKPGKSRRLRFFVLGVQRICNTEAQIFFITKARKTKTRKKPSGIDFSSAASFRVFDFRTFVIHLVAARPRRVIRSHPDPCYPWDPWFLVELENIRPLAQNNPEILSPSR